MNQYTITPEQANTRLDKFLTEQLADQTRSQIQKLIKSGTVTINGKPTSVHHFLKAGDVINVSHSKAQVSAPALARKKTKSPVMEPAIIADTPDYLVVNKPSGLLVHRGTDEDEQTLVDWLLRRYPAVAKVGEDPMRPGIVHRLDRDVSGLLVVAKTQAMFDHLKTQFKSRQIKKEYLALVYGSPQRDEGEITFNIDRSSTTGHKMAAVPLSDSKIRGRTAITNFEVIERLKPYTLLRVMPKTGRTHQIRVHLNAYGLPVVGDTIYWPKKLRANLQLPRLFLHAHRLSFTDLDGASQTYSAPLEPALESLLGQLRA